MENFSVPLAATMVAISAIYAIGKVFRRYLETKKPFRELPMPERSHYIWGHSHLMLAGDFKAAFKHLFEETANKSGQVGFWFFRFPVLGVSSVGDARTVLAVEHERRPPRLAVHFLRHFIGEKSLLIINGSAWKFHRSSVARALNPKFLMASRSTMQSVVERMVASLQEKISRSPDKIQELDVEPLMKMITLDVFGEIALSTDFGLCKTLKPSPLVQAFEYLLSGTMRRLREPFNPKNFFFAMPFEQNVVHKRERTFIRSFIADLINQKREALNQGGEDDINLLSHLIRANREVPGEKLRAEDISDEAMMDIVMTLLFAGYDTTSVTLTFALYLLAQNPEAQQQCVDEINVARTCQTVENLAYTKAVIMEVLRLFPAAVGTNRILAKPLQLSGGLVAPTGTRVFIPIYHIHHDEKNFPHPEEFRPDRWAKFDEEQKCWFEREENDKAGAIVAGNRKAFLAFSAGGRNCVGQRFAIQEAVIVLATLLKGLRFSPVEGYVLEMTDKDLINKPVNGMPLKVESRI